MFHAVDPKLDYVSSDMLVERTQLKPEFCFSFWRITKNNNVSDSLTVHKCSLHN